MAYSKTWDETIPDGSTALLSDVDTFIKDTKIGVRERLASEHADVTGTTGTATLTHTAGKCSVAKVDTVANIKAVTPNAAGGIGVATDTASSSTADKVDIHLYYYTGAAWKWGNIAHTHTDYSNQKLGFTNLHIAVTGNTTFTISCGTACLTNGTLFYNAAPSTITVDCAGTGANGLDTGSLAANDAYSIWLIYNGTTVAGLASTAFAWGSVTAPSGYTYYLRVGSVVTDGSGNFRVTVQHNERVWYTNSAVPGITGFNQTSMTSLNGGSYNLEYYVPNNAIVANVRGVINFGGTYAREAYLNSRSTADGAAASLMVSGYSTNGNFAAGQGDIPLYTAQTIYAMIDTATTTTLDIYILGWVDNI